ncbi:MAG TPA: shikimate kinase [Bacteroidota bacterium]|nr:shikimate kinase [Bacteroidota bacterium]
MEHSRKHLVYLTGFMGSGKSTIGPILGNTLGYRHIDIDQEIERAAGKKVAEIFSEFGEVYFRDAERKILREASGQTGCVISLGGGTIASRENFQIIKSTGILIYLRTDPEQIFRRMKYKADRPLLRSNEGTMLSEREIRDRISHLLAQREPYYAQADLVIQTDGRRVGLTVDEIVHALKHLHLK